MSAISVSSCSGSGSTTSIAGSKFLRRSFPRRRCSLALSSAGTGSGAFAFKSPRKAFTSLVVRASAVDSYENSSDFVKRMEQTWLISQVLVYPLYPKTFSRFLDFLGCEFIRAIEIDGFPVDED